MANQDFKLVNEDLQFLNGDILIGESDTQHVSDTLKSFPGWWKEFPSDGVGMPDTISGPVDVQEIRRRVQIQLASDRYDVEDVIVTYQSGKLIVSPKIRLQ